MPKLSKLLKNTVDLNVKYSTALLGLSKGYIRDLDKTIGGSALLNTAQSEQAQFEQTHFEQTHFEETHFEETHFEETKYAQTSNDINEVDRDQVESRLNRAALLLASESGETAQAAFPIENSSTELLEVELEIADEQLADIVSISPKSFAIRPGRSAIVRLFARVDDRVEAHHCYSGRVLVSGLPNHFVDFMLVKLESA